MGDFFVSSQQLSERMARGEALRVFDVRRRQALEASSRFIPGSRWRNHMQTAHWTGQVAAGTPVVVTCMHGHNVSQIAATCLREKNVSAQVLSGGIDGWLEAGYASVGQSETAPIERQTPSRWVLPLGAGIDAIAGAWLIARFIDPDAELHFVAPEWLSDVADELGATACNSSKNPANLCFFDMILQFFDIRDAALAKIAPMVRGAAGGDAAPAPEAAGLRHVALGIAARATSDHQAVQLALPVYEALYAAARHAGAGGPAGGIHARGIHAGGIKEAAAT